MSNIMVVMCQNKNTPEWPASGVFIYDLLRLSKAPKSFKKVVGLEGRQGLSLNLLSYHVDSDLSFKIKTNLDGDFFLTKRLDGFA